MTKRSVAVPALQGAQWSAPRPGEHLVVELRRHGSGLLGTATRIVLIAAVTGFLAGWIAKPLDASPGAIPAVRWTIFGIGAALILLIAGKRFSRWAYARAAITSSRIAISYQPRQRGWDIPLLTVIDVSCKAGLMQRLSGCGSVVIRTNFASDPAIIADVVRPAEIRDLILALRAQAWADYQRALWGSDTNPMQAAS